MTISIGVRVPNVELFVMGADGPTAISSDDLFGAKLVALFGLPVRPAPIGQNVHPLPEPIS